MTWHPEWHFMSVVQVTDITEIRLGHQAGFHAHQKANFKAPSLTLPIEQCSEFQSLQMAKFFSNHHPSSALTVC